MKWFHPKFIDNDGWLHLKVGISTMLDRVGIARKVEHQRRRFEQVHTYCLFIGYPRSGHSVVGSVIDAHPNALMAHRLDSLQYVARGYSALEVFYLIARNSERFARSGRQLTGYRYNVPNQWHGRDQVLSVVGDQEGNRSSVRLARDPGLLRPLVDGSRVKVRFIHVIRNPFDNITTWALRDQSTLERSVERYFSRCANVMQIKQSTPPGDLLDIRHEEFVSNFDAECRKLLGFLSLDVSDEFVTDCASIVYHSPHRSRTQIEWPRRLIEQTEARFAEYPFLSGYRFAD